MFKSGVFWTTFWPLFRPVKTIKIGKTDREREPISAKTSKLAIFVKMTTFWPLSGPLWFYPKISGFYCFRGLRFSHGFLAKSRNFSKFQRKHRKTRFFVFSLKMSPTDLILWKVPFSTNFTKKTTKNSEFWHFPWGLDRGLARPVSGVLLVVSGVAQWCQNCHFWHFPWGLVGVFARNVSFDGFSLFFRVFSGFCREIDVPPDWLGVWKLKKSKKCQNSPLFGP